MQVILLRGREEEAHRKRQEKQRHDPDDGGGGEADHDFAANRPCGLMKIATMKNRKAMA